MGLSAIASMPRPLRVVAHWHLTSVSFPCCFSCTPSSSPTPRRRQGTWHLSRRPSSLCACCRTPHALLRRRPSSPDPPRRPAFYCAPTPRSSREALAEAAGSLQKQNADLRFITSQQQSRLDALQQENDALRARFHESLVQNGIVLPSGHEVRQAAPPPAPRALSVIVRSRCATRGRRPVAPR